MSVMRWAIPPACRTLHSPLPHPLPQRARQLQLQWDHRTEVGNSSPPASPTHVSSTSEGKTLRALGVADSASPVPGRWGLRFRWDFRRPKRWHKKKGLQGLIKKTTI
jgi:hypothetical protein